MKAKFCEACGAPRHAPGEDDCPCTRCGWHNAEHPLPIVVTIVRRGERVLLVRPREPPARWRLPQSPLGVHESIETAAVAQVRRRTGLVVRLAGLVDVQTAWNGPRASRLLVAFAGEEVAGELAPGEDEQEVAFYAPDSLPDDLDHEVKRFLTRLTTGESR